MTTKPTLDELIDDLVWAEKPEHKCNLCNGHSDTEIEALIKKALTPQIMKHTPEVKSLLEAVKNIRDARFNNPNQEMGDLLLYKHEVARAALKEWE